LGSLRTFEDLECWKKAAELRRKIFALVKTFPQEEKFRLVDQMIRSSRSATAQIAEGYGRFHYQENIQYCRQARGSVYELLDHLIAANECGYLSGDQLDTYKVAINDCLGLLNGYINYLAKAKASSGASEPAELYGGKPINY
jgi:four helix bundle protein